MLAEQDIQMNKIQTMEVSEIKNEVEKYVTPKYQKIREITRQLAFHISACQIIADTLGSDFQALQTIEQLMLNCKERKECLTYIERNIGILYHFV